MFHLTVILQIGLTLVCVLWLAAYFQISLVEAMPVFLCGLVLVLYGLAMVHHLSWIDWAAGIVISLFVFWIVGRQRESRKEFGRTCLEKIKQPSFITAVLLIVVIVLCTSGKVVTWWDDINFWATDVRHSTIWTVLPVNTGMWRRNSGIIRRGHSWLNGGFCMFAQARFVRGWRLRDTM